MSQFDHGKHIVAQAHTDEAGVKHEEIRSDRRLDGQRAPKPLAARQADFDSNKLGNVGSGAYNRPGSQNRNK